jgi:tRNA(Arg) A34 adenosine deaminase TadA/predicted kinase
MWLTTAGLLLVMVAVAMIRRAVGSTTHVISWTATTSSTAGARCRHGYNWPPDSFSSMPTLMTFWQELTLPWQVCLEEAWAAYRAGSLPIGAAVVDRDGSIVGRGRNRVFENLAEQPHAPYLFGHRLAHAEVNALVSIDHAAVRARECALYTTLEPCALCVGAIRMLALRDVRYAARDPAAGSVTLLDATDFMRRGAVQAQHLRHSALEGVLIAMNVVALLSLAQRFEVRPPIDIWEAERLPGVDLGRQLFASGHLKHLADTEARIEVVLDDLMTRYRQHTAAMSSCPPAPTSPRRDASVSRRPLVLIVTGPPASGKSTLGEQLALRLGLPFLSKDLFKEILFDQLGWSDREWSRRLGGASMALLFRSAAALLEAGQSVALESNFYPAWDTPQLRRLADQFGCRFVQVVCTASGPTLVERYRRRIVTCERHPGHTDSEWLEEMLSRLLSERWNALDLEGPVISVDTEREAPVDAIVEEIRKAVRPPESKCETTAGRISCT